MTGAMHAAEPQAMRSELSADDMYRLGLEASTMNEAGDVNLIDAHMWFNLAAMRGNIEARAYRAELSREMAPDEVAEAQRLAREYLAVHEPRRAS
jgi:hypothetical protein